MIKLHKFNIVDCERHRVLCTSRGVTRFPKIFFYMHDVKTERKTQGHVWGRGGSEPVIVVVDHEVSVVPSRRGLLTTRSSWCTLTGTGRGIRSGSTRRASRLRSGRFWQVWRTRNTGEMCLRGMYACLFYLVNAWDCSRSMRSGPVWMQGRIVTHPYMTMLAILGLVGVVIMALRSPFADDPAD